MIFDLCNDHQHHVLLVNHIDQSQLNQRWAWCENECASTFDVVWLEFRDKQRRLGFVFAHRADAEHFNQHWETTLD